MEKKELDEEVLERLPKQARDVLRFWKEGNYEDEERRLDAIPES